MISMAYFVVRLASRFDMAVDGKLAFDPPPPVRDDRERDELCGDDVDVPRVSEVEVDFRIRPLD